MSKIRSKLIYTKIQDRPKMSVFVNKMGCYEKQTIFKSDFVK